MSAPDQHDLQLERQLLAVIPDGVALLERDGRIVYVNAALVQIMRTPREEIIGRRYIEVFPGAMRQPFHRAFEQVAWGESEGVTVESFHERIDLWTESRIERWGDRIVVVMRDASERVRAERERAALAEALAAERAKADLLKAEAEAERARLEQIFSEAPVPVAVTEGAANVFVLANARFREVFHDREMLGRPLRDALSELEGQGVFELIDHALTTGEQVKASEFPVAIDSPDGTRVGRFFDFILEPRHAPGGTVDGLVCVGIEVTEQVRARRSVEALLRALREQQAALARSEARFRGVQEASPDGFALLRPLRDETGQVVDFEVTYVNAAASRMARRGGAEITGRRLLDILPGTRATGLFEVNVRALESRQPSSFETPYDADGVSGWFRVTTVPVEEGVAITFADITAEWREDERRVFLAEATMAMAKLLDEGAMLDTLAELLVPRFADWCMVDFLDEQGQIERAAVHHIDPEKRAWARRWWQDFAPEGPDAEWLRGVIQARRPVGIIDYREPQVLERASKPVADALREIRAKQGYIVPLAHGERAFGAITLMMAESERTFDEGDLRLFQDLADRAAIALDNARLYAVARAERARAEEASRFKDEFLATLSHELRTPMNAILGWLSLLERDPSGPLGAKALGVLRRNAVAQARLIDDILDASRIVTGKLRLEPKPVELGSLVDEATEVVRPSADAKRVGVTVSRPVGAVTVLGDEGRLRQVVWNLLSNAVKFTDEGGHIDVKLEADRYSALLTVSDTGKGIDPSFLPHVFDRFRQGDSSTTRRFGGLGLGLAIVRHLVELHGGQVTAESEGEGRGATFRVLLPLPSASSSDAAVGSTGEGGARLDGLRVLVVDDDEDARDLLIASLSSKGASVEAACSAAEAIEEAERAAPDVLVSDVGMPGTDGYAMMKQLRSTGQAGLSDVPAIALTAYAGPGDRDRALEAGFDVHLPKPFDPDALARTVARLARESRKSSPR